MNSFHSILIFCFLTILVSFLGAVIKFPDKSNLKENGFILAHGSRVQFIMAGEPRTRSLKQLFTSSLPWCPPWCSPSGYRGMNEQRVKKRSAPFLHVYRTGSHAGNGATHSRHAFPFSEHSQDDMPQAHLETRLSGDPTFCQEES